MDDLISEFFKRELTEAETAALKERLLSSSEDALRFGELAKKAYLRYGWPEPHLHGKPGGPGPGPGGGHHGGAGGGGLHPGPLHPFLHWMPMGLKPILAISLAVTAGVTGVVALKMESNKKLPQSPAPITVTAPSNPVPVSASSRQGTIAATPTHPPAPLTHFTPVTTPVEITAQTHPVFSDLAVMVRQASAGPLSVKVLTTDGKFLVLLFDGPLGAGNWAFEWDGHLQDGQMAPSGIYEILVESGSFQQKKMIVIR